MKKTAKVIVVMPAYNAAKTLGQTWARIPKKVVDEFILVDDASKDETVAIAKKLGIKVIVHPRNRGYGGNQKTCYTHALKSGGEVMIMLHPDGQYDPRVIPHLVKKIRQGYDLVLGSRFLTQGGALKGGMPLYKFISNRFLTMVENIAFGIKISEGHTGYRAYSRRFLEKVPFKKNQDDFVFDSQVIAQAAYFGLPIGEIAIQTRYFAEASSVNFKGSIIYGLKTLAIALAFVLQKAGLAHFTFLTTSSGRKKGR